jgi:hypothetical protein
MILTPISSKFVQGPCTRTLYEAFIGRSSNANSDLTVVLQGTEGLYN